MATLTPDSRVVMAPNRAAELFHPPMALDQLAVAVQVGALRAPSNALTQLVEFKESQIAWVGAVDEAMVVPLPGVIPQARKALWARLLVGPRLWEVVRPGLLTRPGVGRPLLTVYDGDRPWVVIGELVGGDLVAAPLNDARGNPKSWTPVVAADQLGFPGSKPSQVELAHLWSLPPTLRAVGTVKAAGAASISSAIGRYL